MSSGNYTLAGWLKQQPNVSWLPALGCVLLLARLCTGPHFAHLRNHSMVH